MSAPVRSALDYRSPFCYGRAQSVTLQLPTRPPASRPYGDCFVAHYVVVHSQLERAPTKNQRKSPRSRSYSGQPLRIYEGQAQAREREAVLVLSDVRRDLHQPVPAFHVSYLGQSTRNLDDLRIDRVYVNNHIPGLAQARSGHRSRSAYLRNAKFSIK